MCESYDKSVDMWGIGIITYILLAGYPPFYADLELYGSRTDERIFDLVKKGFDPVTRDGYGPHFPKAIPCTDSAKDLMARLITLDTAKRITAAEALEHPWLTGEKADNKPMMGTVLSNLNNFRYKYKFKQALLTVMSDTMTEAELTALQKTFKTLDENGDGVITVTEMKNAIQKWGGVGSIADQKNPNSEYLLNLMKTADVDGDGALSYNELLMTCVQRKLNAKEERLWNAFCKLDLNNDGRITKDEVEQVLNAKDAKELIAEVDINGDGTIDYEEFIKMWSSKEAEEFEEITKDMKEQDKAKATVKDDQKSKV